MQSPTASNTIGTSGYPTKIMEPEVMSKVCFGLGDPEPEPQRQRTQSSEEPEPERLRTASLISSKSEPEPGPPAPASPGLSPAPLCTPTPTSELPQVARNARFRKSCYYEATLRCGVLNWTTYNHMLLPSLYNWYKTPNEEYEHLKTHVCIWDVAAERQVEISGPDAVTLVELLTPRPLGDMKVGQCRYAIITDEDGMVLNDPVVSRMAEDRFWLSGADGDLVLWAKGLAIGKSLKVKVSEADVSPLALQGPKSTAMLAEIFGDWIYDLKYFHFKEVSLDGMPIALARSGWSPEVGYELYLQDESRGDELWERLWKVGEKYNILPGSPNQKRRIEGGMLNFGSDITTEHNILELGLPPSMVGAPGKCKEADFIGKETLTRIHNEGGAQRSVVGVKFSSTEACPPLGYFWGISQAGDTWSHCAGDTAETSERIELGKLTSLTFSPALNSWIGIATVSKEAAAEGTIVCVQTPDGKRDVVVQKLPFMPRAKMAPRPEAASA